LQTAAATITRLADHRSPRTPMPRSFEISVPSATADAILRRIEGIDGVVGHGVQRGASLDPPGDVLTIHTTNDATRPVTDLLAELGVPDSGSVVTSEPRSVIARAHRDLLDRESNETTWDEMAFMLREDTNLAVNYLALMMLAGAIAAVGLWADTLHVIIGAMVIAPAFEPLVRMPFGVIVGRSRIAIGGLASAAAGYAMLTLGAIGAVVIMRALEGPVELESREWVRFWTTPTAAGAVTSAFAAAAGALVITGQRSVLTTGVMIALALIPSMCIVGMGIAVGDLALAGRGLVRWAIDATLVLGIGGAVLGSKKVYLQRSDALS
jgi:hypothetical protein